MPVAPVAPPASATPVAAPAAASPEPRPDGPAPDASPGADPTLAIMNDPLVRKAVEVFGGRVLRVEPRKKES